MPLMGLWGSASPVGQHRGVVSWLVGYRASTEVDYVDMHRSKVWSFGGGVVVLSPLEISPTVVRYTIC